jgi:ATP-dependent RNA helicase SUPV3L1/SUV3
LASDKDEAFALDAGGLVLWRGQAAGAVTLADPFSPAVRLLTDLGAAPARERAARRLEAFAAAETRRRWAPLWRLSQAVREGGVQGLARGVAWRLVEAAGTLARREVETEVAALSRAERRQLRRLGVRIGAFALFVPSLLTADAAVLAAMLASDDPRAEALQGRVRLGDITPPAVELEALAEVLRAAPSRHGGRLLSRAALAAVGVDASQAEAMLRALGFAPVGRGEADGSRLWRRRREAPTRSAQPHSPFAILARLETAPPRRRRRRAQRG